MANFSYAWADTASGSGKHNDNLTKSLVDFKAEVQSQEVYQSLQHLTGVQHKALRIHIYSRNAEF